MSAIVARGYSTALWVTLHNQFPQADSKVTGVAQARIPRGALNVQAALDRRAYLLAVRDQIEKWPTVVDLTIDDVNSQIASINQAIASNKQ